MGNGEKYSLRGLNAVFAGLLLTLLVAIVGALANGMILINFGENEIGFYVRIGTSVFLGLGYILVMAGTHSARKHSEKFAKACKYCIFEFVADIILGAILLGTFMYNIGGRRAGYYKRRFIKAFGHFRICGCVCAYDMDIPHPYRKKSYGRLCGRGFGTRGQGLFA